MRRWPAIIAIIAGGAIVLPRFAFAHGSEFLDAKFFFDEAGRAHLEITADYSGNPMLPTEADARAALADALRISWKGQDYPLSTLAPITIAPRKIRDPESPIPRPPQDEHEPQFLTAAWTWAPDAESVHFLVPASSAMTTLFWMREPGVTPPRWSMLVPGDRTPLIAVPAKKFAWPRFSLLAVPLLLAGVVVFRARRRAAEVAPQPVAVAP